MLIQTKHFFAGMFTLVALSMNAISYGQISLPASGIINTVAGNGTAGYTGDGGLATSAALRYPIGIAVDLSGNIYVADFENSAIRMITASTGKISTVAGTGTAGYTGDGGLATNAELNAPAGVAVDSSGNLFIADTNNHRIRKVTASTGNISTVAGNGTEGYAGDGGFATSAKLNYPHGVAVDALGNVYIADTMNSVIRMVAVSNSYISTLCGNGTAGYNGDGYPGTSYELNYPNSVAVDTLGNLYIADSSNSRIRKVTISSGFIITVAGNGTSGYSGDGGQATSAEIKGPNGVTTDISGNLYIGDTGNYRVRMVTASTGIISTAAGNGTAGYVGDGGPSVSAELNVTYGVAVDTSGNIYVVDGFNNRIRAIGSTITPASVSCSPNPTTYGAGTTCTATIGGVNATGTVGWNVNGSLWETDTLSGNTDVVSGLSGNSPGSYSITATYSGDSSHPPASASTSLTIKGLQTISFTAPTSPVTYGVSPIALIATGGASGNPVVFSASGPGQISGSTLTITGPGTVVVAANQAGNAYYYPATQVTQTVVVNYALPTHGIITTIAGNGTAGYTGDGALAANAELSSPWGVTVDTSGNVYIADANNVAIRAISYTNGYIYTEAGPGLGGDGVAVDPYGNFYIANTGYNRLLVGEPSSGTINYYRVAGNGTAGYSGDGGTAPNALLNAPQGVAISTTTGNVYIADTANNRIRMINASTDVITTVAGNGTAGYMGDGSAATSARIYSPYSIAVDSGGNIYIADTYNNRIRKVTASTGIISTVAGNGTYGYSGDGGFATSAELYMPTGVAVSSSGNIYIADFGNNRVRMVNVSTGVISTVAGNGTAGFSGDNGSATSAALYRPAGVALDASGDLYIADANNNRVRVVGH